jgi:hypothetical protein
VPVDAVNLTADEKKCLLALGAAIRGGKRSDGWYYQGKDWATVQQVCRGPLARPDWGTGWEAGKTRRVLRALSQKGLVVEVKRGAWAVHLNGQPVLEQMERDS